MLLDGYLFTVKDKNGLRLSRLILGAFLRSKIIGEYFGKGQLSPKCRREVGEIFKRRKIFTK